MRTICFNLLFIFAISVFLISCSNDDPTNNTGNGNLEEKNTDAIEIIYKGEKFYSKLSSDESTTLFADNVVESLYRKITEKEGSIVSINSEKSWELFDNVQEYETKFSNNIKTPQLKSSNYILELEAYATSATFYEKDYYAGKNWTWSARSTYGKSGIYVCLDSIGLSRSISSFTVDNTSFSRAIQVYFFTLGCQNIGTSNDSYAIVVQPRAKASVYSIGKVWGSKYNDKATLISFSWYPAAQQGIDSYLLESVTYDASSVNISSRDLVLDKKSTAGYPNIPGNYYFSLSGNYTDRVYFKPTSYISPSEMIESGIPIPTIKNGLVDTKNLTDISEWRTVFNNTEQTKQKTVEQSITKKFVVAGETINLIGKEFTYTIDYSATFRKRITSDNTLVAKGKLTVTTQTEHWIESRSGIIIGKP